MERMELMAFTQRDVRRKSVQSFGFREETLDKSMPDHRKTSVQRRQRTEDIILSQLLRVRPQHVRLHWQRDD